ncbi:MAG: bifunctional pyr operon transcriptional regulator/uracil phosphoribosyltransferase PyrR [Endomicrobium sp.]|nr:bifunctional pyr operon transcriptional regulator/uracil phosphoribosyltransferase PyrR [Endomicrobium sp.]
MANTIILNEKSFQNAICRIANDIIIDNKNIQKIAIVGIHSHGVCVAKKILIKITRLADIGDKYQIPFGTLDITLYRDDLNDLKIPVIKDTIIPFDINNKSIVLVDDVLYTGRTVRAALDVLMDFGRPKSIKLAVLIDRGSHELPIKADYVGVRHNNAKGFIKVKCVETDGVDGVYE